MYTEIGARSGTGLAFVFTTASSLNYVFSMVLKVCYNNQISSWDMWCADIKIV
jgi:hypothetical protein